jgi:hypothetical protein
MAFSVSNGRHKNVKALQARRSVSKSEALKTWKLEYKSALGFVFGHLQEETLLATAPRTRGEGVLLYGASNRELKGIPCDQEKWMGTKKRKKHKDPEKRSGIRTIKNHRSKRE